MKEIVRTDPTEEWERPRYSIGAAAERSGLSRDTLRWYERIGLMDYIGRDHTGRRRFSDRDLEWLTLIGRLRTTGMTVADMVRYAELVRQGESTAAERLAMFQKTRTEVLAKIEDLHQTLAVLDYKIDLYAESADRDAVQSPCTVRDQPARRRDDASQAAAVSMLDGAGITA